MGVHFDKKLTWLTHLEATKTFFSKRLVLMKQMTGTSWGFFSKTLMDFYKLYLRGIIEYGIEAYGITSQKQLRILETLQNLAIRIAFGLPSHTAVDTLTGIPGVPKIEERMKILSRNYFTNIQAFGPKHIVTSTLLQDLRSTSQKLPSGVKLFKETILNWRNETVSNSLLIPDSPPPPWRIAALQVILELIPKIKDNLPQQLIIQLFLRCKKKRIT